MHEIPVNIPCTVTILVLMWMANARLPQSNLPWLYLAVLYCPRNWYTYTECIISTIISVYRICILLYTIVPWMGGPTQHTHTCVATACNTGVSTCVVVVPWFHRVSLPWSLLPGHGPTKRHFWHPCARPRGSASEAVGCPDPLGRQGGRPIEHGPCRSGGARRWRNIVSVSKWRVELHRVPALK